MTAIHVENVSKLYRLGTVGTGTIAHDLNRWWHRIRGKEDPYSKVGQVNDRSVAQTDSTSDYVWALRDINLKVEQGEVLGIIGRNGAGKSTLLKLLSRVTAPTTGVIKTRGSIASLLEVGTGFHPELTGRENIFLNGAILGMKRHEINKELDAIADFSGCAKYLDTPVKRYSSGMTVRLGFAVAAHLRSDVLIIDEVLAVGDASFQRKCIKSISTLAGNKTVLFVSHQLPLVSSLCTKTAVLENGKISFAGRTDEAISVYASKSPADTKNDLNTRKDRKGNGELLFTSFNLISPDGNRCGIVKTGDDVILELEYKATHHDSIGRPLQIGISLYDLLGNLKFAVNTDASGDRFVLEPEGKLSCRIRKWPLTQGVYSITLYSEVNGTIADWIEEAANIEVDDGDFFGTGRLPAKGSCGVMIPFEWVGNTHSSIES